MFPIAVNITFLAVKNNAKFYSPIISRTIMLDALIVPTRISISKIRLPIYVHTWVTAEAEASTWGGAEAKREKITQENAMITPSRHTPA